MAEDVLNQLIKDVKKKRRIHGAGLAGFGTLSLISLMALLTNDGTTMEEILLLSSTLGTVYEGKCFYRDNKAIKKFNDTMNQFSLK